jgi:hypothetical protein
MQGSSVSFTIPDFKDADGIEYTEVSVSIEMDSDLDDTVKLVETLQRPVTERP